MKKYVKWIIFVAGVACLTLLDQITKVLAQSKLMGQDAIPIIKDVFELRYLENRGAAFGILQGRAVPLLIFTVILAAGIAWLYGRTPEDRKHRVFRYSLIFLFAGAIGNMIDRFMNQYVIDFLYFKLIDFPIFNVADCYVTCSVVVIAWIYLFVFKEEEDLAFMQLKKKKEDQDE